MKPIVNITIDGKQRNFNPSINDVLTNDGSPYVVLQLKWETTKGSFVTYTQVAIQDLVDNFQQYEEAVKGFK